MKKLNLSKETLRVMNGAEADALGGMPGEGPISMILSCTSWGIGCLYSLRCSGSVLLQNVD